MLALFNLTFRLSREFVSEWDESLYGISAWEALTRGSWLGTTFFDRLDYYNSKPPLMVWLIAAAFKLFGPGLISLRLPSAACAWLTVAMLLQWTKRCFGLRVSLLASLILTTTFGFIYVHSGRSAATDAPFTLLVLLTVIVLWAEDGQPWQRVWLGPILAAAFLLRGMAVLMPMALVLIAAAARPRQRPTAWRPTVVAAALFVLPVVGWMVARYRIDGWTFIARLFLYDFVARSVRPIEGHPGGILYYVNILQKHHYDWLLAGAMALLMFPLSVGSIRVFLRNRPEKLDVRLLLWWTAITFAIPTMMRTKVPWYLNTFYPAFAVALALVLDHAFRVTSAAQSGDDVCHRHRSDPHARASAAPR
ncbi:MAG TPA: glycosyltransferase family 39 protein [Vicinamibacterales bacterium]|nr:glycosyltransferase family 39 protein [Vicinamibacterales bacterium]